jgi:hypothetical protein
MPSVETREPSGGRDSSSYAFIAVSTCRVDRCGAIWTSSEAAAAGHRPAGSVIGLTSTANRGFQVFDDAVKSPLSIVVLDDIER